MNSQPLAMLVALRSKKSACRSSAPGSSTVALPKTSSV
jgi:hypothetical protein